MKIQVTQDHIDAGKPDNMCECPIALALKEELFKHRVSVISLSVAAETVTIEFMRDGKDVTNTAELPEEPQRFIEIFDNTDAAEPFEFDLSLETET